MISQTRIFGGSFWKSWLPRYCSMALWKPPPVTERLSTSTLAYCLRKPSKLYCAELKLVPTSTTSGAVVSPNSSELSSLGSVATRVKYSLA
ncbi:hypothetical protein D3C78_1573620 [compost metagenome]